jgi:hypothetical protein
MPVFRYVPYKEDSRRSTRGGDHRNSKWRQDPRKDEEEVKEQQDDGIDMAQLMNIDEKKVAELLQRQSTSAKSIKRKKNRKKEKDVATTLEQVIYLWKFSHILSLFLCPCA